MPQTLVVTGSAGFIGSHLAAALLARGERVVGVDDLDPFYDPALKRLNLESLASEAFEFVHADIRDAQAMQSVFAQVKADGMFHVAALAGVRPSIKEPARYASVNVDGLVSVLEAARAIGCRRVVFASSSSVYGNNRKVPFAESDPVDEPISPYAATKRAGELICRTYSHLFGMSIACARLFTVFGPAQRPDLAIHKFMRLIAAGEPVPMYGDGSTSRDYTYVDDVVEGMLAAYGRLSATEPGSMEAPGFFRIWNLGGSRPVALARLIELIGGVVCKTPHIEQLPLPPGDVGQTWADLARSRAELGYEPRTSLEDGLARQWDWIMRHLDRFATAASV